MATLGHHSSTQYPDAMNAVIVGADGKETPVPEVVCDDAWLQGDYVKTVASRGKAIIDARKVSHANIAVSATSVPLHSH